MKSFYKNKGPFDINYILKKTSFTIKDKLKKKNVIDISTLDNAKKNEITFFDNIKYLPALKRTNASYCLIEKKNLSYTKDLKITPIISNKPLLDFILIAKIFYPEADSEIYDFKKCKKYESYLKKNTLIDSRVKIGKNLIIGINSTIKKNVKIGNNVKIGSNCSISNCVIEDNVIINDGSVIGKIGYGFKYINGKFYFIPHIGCVHLHKNVYIGSNCTIDRGSFSNTIVGNNTMIDNLVHIAHNVSIGSYSYIAGQVGIAGSSKIGNRCMIGGQSGISGHLSLGNNVNIGGHSGVLKNISDNSRVIGFPAIPIRDFLKRNKND